MGGGGWRRVLRKEQLKKRSENTKLLKGVRKEQRSWGRQRGGKRNCWERAGGKGLRLEEVLGGQQWLGAASGRELVEPGRHHGEAGEVESTLTGSPE